MFVVAEDFNRKPYQIFNLSEYETVFGNMIEDVEKEVLCEVFGDYFYNAFMTGLAADPVDQRWTDLKDGVAYTTANGYVRNWKGMKAVFIPMVYGRWLHDNYNDWTETGDSVQASENADLNTPANRIVRAINEASELIGVEDYWNDYDRINTLFGYLESTGALYDDVILGSGYTDFQTYLRNEFRSLGRLNTFGL